MDAKADNQTSRLVTDATLLWNRGLGEEAAEKYLQAAALYEQEGNIAEVASCWHMAGVSLKHRPKEAEEAFAKASQYYRQAGDEVGVGRVYRDQAIPFAYQHNYDKSLKWLEKSESALRKADAKAELGITIAKIGRLLTGMGKFDEAERRLEEGLALIREQPSWFYEMTALMHAAQLRLEEKDYQGVITYVWAGIGALSNERPELDQAELIETFGRRFAQLFGLLAHGYYHAGNCALGIDYFAQSMALIEPLDEDAKKVLLDDIKAKEFVAESKLDYVI